MGFKSLDFQNILGGEMTRKKCLLLFLEADLLLLKTRAYFYDVAFITWKTHENLSYVGIVLTLHFQEKCLDFAEYFLTKLTCQHYMQQVYNFAILFENLKIVNLENQMARWPSFSKELYGLFSQAVKTFQRCFQTTSNSLGLTLNPSPLSHTFVF